MAGELKTPWTDPIMSGSGDLSGNLSVGARGTDPLVDLSGGSALKDFFDKQVVPVPAGQETPNSLSGLPLNIQRVEASDQPPSPPTLENRMPGTIDQ